MGGAAPKKYLRLRRLELWGRDLERGKPRLPKKEREGKVFRRLRPQGLGGLPKETLENKNAVVKQFRQTLDDDGRLNLEPYTFNHHVPVVALAFGLKAPDDSWPSSLTDCCFGGGSVLEEALFWRRPYFGGGVVLKEALF